MGLNLPTSSTIVQLRGKIAFHVDTQIQTKVNVCHLSKDTNLIECLDSAGAFATKLHVLGSKLPSFPYSGRWSSTLSIVGFTYPIVGVVYPIQGFPIESGMTTTHTVTFDPGTYEDVKFLSNQDLIM